jgi:hypothetical protein
MRLIEWEVKEDDYQEQINIPSEQRNIAKEEGIGTEDKEKVTVQITNFNAGEIYTARLSITGTNQIYVPVEIQQMLRDSGKIRIQILGA